MIDYRIFLSSPGDCEDERQSVHRVVKRLNDDPIVRSFAHVSVIAWDWNAGIPFEALRSPQVSVNTLLPVPEQCNLFLGIFRCRFGTPMPLSDFRKPDGTQYLSGTEYEFYRAWEARRKGAELPEVLIYRWKPDAGSSCPDDEQYQNQEAFFKRAPFQEDGKWSGSCGNFKDTDDFVNQVEAHLRTLLSQRYPGTQLKLSEWACRQASILTTNAGPRYTKAAHVATVISDVFDWLLVRRSAISSFDSALALVYKAVPTTPDFSEYRQELENAAASLRENYAWMTLPDFSKTSEMLKKLRDYASSEYEKKSAESKGAADRAASEKQQRTLRELRETVERARDAHSLLKKYAALAERRVLLLKGPAGQGKTHTLVHEMNKTLQDGGLAVGVLGQMLNASGGLWQAFCERLDWSGSTDELLDSLENEAANANQRALIVFDAINETPDRLRWRRELLAMIEAVQRRPHLALAISVRSDYARQMLPVVSESSVEPWISWGHPGFIGIEPEALSKYFEFYGVTVPGAPPFGEFNNPLYVQLLAKSLTKRELNHWQPSWLDVWNAWMERIESDAKDVLGLDDPSRPQPVRRIMKRLAKAMVECGKFTIPRSEADAIAAQISGNTKTISFLCSAGALIDRIDEADEDVIEFGFERLSDTFVVDQILAQIFKNLQTSAEKLGALKAAFEVGGLLQPLATIEWSDHPLYKRRAGLLEALCLATPRSTGVELPVLIGSSSNDDWELAASFVDSLRWRSNPRDFGADLTELRRLWQSNSLEMSEDAILDDLIRFSMIPGHPLGMDEIIHPQLVSQGSPGERDAIWSTKLVSLWESETSSLRQLVEWARDSDLSNIHPEIALPSARLLAWICSTSQRALRESAIKGLTRVLVARPTVVPEFLPDFLEVNDPYILEAVLVATWGVILDGRDPEVSATAAQLVYQTQFIEGAPRWCHVIIRHYVRIIIEEADKRGLLSRTSADHRLISPPYHSVLPLNQVPSKAVLEGLDSSRGFLAIVSSSTGWDFYRYVMGGNSASIPFSCTPLASSQEPSRPFTRSENFISGNAQPDVFDLALAGRFIAWNTLSLGWTSERFEDFDTGYLTRERSRVSEEGRTERIGKKYQWISWHTLLAFLADNYEMRPDWDKTVKAYDGPDQLSLQLYDPIRWLKVTTKSLDSDGIDQFWKLPIPPNWPRPEIDEMRQWIRSTSFDLPPMHMVTSIPQLPPSWGDGPWIRVFAEHSWETDFAPGHWALGRDFRADLWWQLWPVLIENKDLPSLLASIETADVRAALCGSGRIDPNQNWNVPLAHWPNSQLDWDVGFDKSSDNDRRNNWLPCASRPFVAECGHPDRRDENAPSVLPVPSLFKELNLQLDFKNGVIRHENEIVFGLTSGPEGRGVLFAKVRPLLELLNSSQCSLVWLIRGERRAFQNLTGHEDGTTVWADFYGVGLLPQTGDPTVLFLSKINVDT